MAEFRNPPAGPGFENPILPLTWTISSTWTTNTTYTSDVFILGEKRLMGNTLVEFSGAPNTGNFDITMPAGWNINTTMMPANSGIIARGYPFVVGGFEYVGTVVDATTIRMFSVTVSGGTVFAAGAAVSRTSPFTVVNGEKISITWDIPVIAA